MLIILVSLIQDIPMCIGWRCGLNSHSSGRKCEFPGVPISRVDKRIYGRRGMGFQVPSRTSKAQTLHLSMLRWQ